MPNAFQKENVAFCESSTKHLFLKKLLLFILLLLLGSFLFVCFSSVFSENVLNDLNQIKNTLLENKIMKFVKCHSAS